METIQEYECRVFTVQDIHVLIQKRFEHLTEEDMKRINKQQLAKLLTKPSEMKKQIKKVEQKAKIRKEQLAEARRAAKSKDGSNATATSSATTATTNTNANDNPRPSVSASAESGPKFHDEPDEQADSDAAENSDGEFDKDEFEGAEEFEVDESEDVEGSLEDETDSLDDIKKHRESLPLPTETVSYDDYFKKNKATNFDPHKIDSVPTGRPPYVHIGRPMNLKVEKKTYKASVWMCDDYPLTVESLIEILDLVAPQKRHIGKFVLYAMCFAVTDQFLSITFNRDCC